MTISEAIYGVFFEPVNTLRTLSREQSLIRGLLLFMIASLLSAFFNQAVTSTQGITLFNGKASVFTGLLGFILSLGGLFVMVGLYSVLGELFFKKTNILSMLSCMSYASLPGVLGSSVCVAFVFLGFESLGILFSGLGSLWAMVLSIISIREALELDISQSVLLFFIPPMALAAFMLAAVVGLLLALLA